MSSAQTMKIYSILSKIEQLLAESPKPKFNNAGNRRIVDTDELNALLGDLKATIPEDIRRASGIITERENTLRDANEQADVIVAMAQKEADELHNQAQEAAENVYRQAVAEYEALVSESSVYSEAVARAEALRIASEENADAICNGARAYADDILADVQRYLNAYMKMINGNREELDVRPMPEVRTEPVVAQEPRQETPKPEPKPAVKKAEPKPVEPEEEEELEEDEFEEKPEKNKRKKGWFKRMLEGDDDEEEYEDEDEYEEPVKPAKKKNRLFSFDEDDEDEE